MGDTRTDGRGGRSLKPIVAREFEWRRTGRDTIALYGPSGQNLEELPAASPQHRRAVAVLDHLVPTLDTAGRELFSRLAQEATDELDAAAFITVCGLIKRGYTYEQLRKYVGAGAPQREQAALRL